MKIAVVGTGYVGLVAGACFAEIGNTVWCVDKDEAKITNLEAGLLPIYEPGLPEMVAKNVANGRLHFSAALQPALAQAELCFITVGTPPRADGAADLSQVYTVAQEIGQLLDHHLIVVNKSTVPVGTAEIVRSIIAQELKRRGQENVTFAVVSNPEFLREGRAINDFMRPDRVVIGTDSNEAAKIMKELYQPIVRDQHPLLIMDIKSAELTKYAANAMLATRISFMNEIARLCDKVGADVNRVRQGMGADGRIGLQFLDAGAGYGGSCFPKDVKELIHTGRKYGLEMAIIQAVDQVNERQKHYLAEMIGRYFGDNLAQKKFALWGLAFKPETDDIREAPALAIIRSLVHRGATITAYDPQAIPQAKVALTGCGGRLFYAENKMAALDDADALILVTEWQEFTQPDFAEMKRRLRQPLIFDGRNQYDPVGMAALGFEYYCIGRGYCV
ncbi:UDPglucose 6-dehydrogenase [Sporolituus thermophilus DSM 23256]|uniref:UDP-glucose 6-dehydrogenase n=2 Tax=Sporolituus TaxID=909931 RepID=A0A1G7LXT6_9FIRM|nr:UDPglucose 6-dehydrogenase [Sporolituus thermophilus DSM 23256]